MISSKTSIALRASTGVCAIALALITTPSFAQEKPADSDEGVIVVTGSIIKQALTPSPVSTITVDQMDKRGISTVQEGIQRIAANNGPALTNSFTANGAFAAGASAVSLRGLTTNSTLVLFDGMRAAYYPLADDGTRNFVDLNTIPDDIVEKVDVLKDGASATYGADAIAGVVNIITKKEFKGLAGRAEAGVSSRGDASQYRMSMTAGFGDLQDQGVNAYISGFYYKQDKLNNRERPYPYNSDDFSGICNEGTCGFNGVVNGLQPDGYTGGFGGATPFAVRPRNPATGTAAPVPNAARYSYLNGCQGLPSYTPTAAELALPANASAPASGPVCQEDVTKLYGVITPKIERFGFSAHATALVGNDIEVSGMFNFTQSSSYDDYIPATIRGNAPAPFYFPRYSTSANVAYYGNNTVLQLPVYVCARGTTAACTAANGKLNPNNPYASQGYTAAILGRIPNLREQNYSRTRNFRGALSVSGPITDKWDFSVKATAMHIDLQRKNDGYVYIQHLLDVIADGSYNFVNPELNSQATLDYLAPTARSTSTSDLVQGDASVQGQLFDLPGGPLSVAFGASVRYEAVDSPSINSDINGGTQRYFRLNGFATKGNRTVYSAYGEINAPILKPLTLNLSGRYDKYPQGIDNFSPKVGATFQPFDRVLTIKGTYSRGFRIPSFGEANATFPTTGYVTANAAIFPDSYLRTFGCTKATYNTCPAYLQGSSYSYGSTSVSNPDLKPEKSQSFTGTISVEPIRNVNFAVTYYNIRKTNVITTPSNAAAINAYYTGTAIPAGFTVIPDAVDTNNPNNLPRIAFVQAPFINANKLKTSGLDFTLDANVMLNDDIRLTTTAEATYILKLETIFPDGTVERYDGTLGNFNLTAGSGTPKWKGYATVGLEVKKQVSMALSVNYYGGYDLSATDQGTGYKDCGLSDGSIPCKVRRYITLDLNLQAKINDKFTVYTTVQNLLDDLPPIDTVTYGAHGYNPIQGGEGILGRYFKVGVKADF